MMANSNIDIIITAKDLASGAIKSVNSSLGALSGVAGSSTGTLGTIGNVLGGIGKASLIATTAMGAGFTAVAGKGVAFNSQIEQLKTSFEVMTGSADKANEVIEKLKKVGASTPYELTGLADTAKMLMQYGFTADNAYDTTLLLGDISQGSSEKMESIAYAFGQMSSAGKVNMQDMRQMINAGFNPLQAIADKTGKTMQQVTKEYEAGKISVQDVADAMKYASSEGGAYYQSMEKQSKTLNGQVSTLKDNFNMLAGVLAGGLTEGIKGGALPAINDLLSSLTSAYESGGIEGFAEALGKGVTDLVTRFVESAPEMINAGVTLIQSLITGFQENLPSLMDSAITIINTLLTSIISMLPQILQMGIDILVALLNGIATMLPTLVPTVVDMILLLVNTIIENLPTIITAGIQVIIALVQGLVEAIPTLIDYIPTIIESLVGAVILLLPEIIVAGIEIIVALIKGLVVAIPKIVEMVPEIIIAIVNALIENIPKMWETGKSLVEGLWEGIKNAGTWIKDKLTGWGTEVIQTVKDLFGIASPSKLMETEVGFNLGAGIAEGIKGSVSLVEDAMGSMNNAVMGSVNPVIVGGDSAGTTMISNTRSKIAGNLQGAGNGGNVYNVSINAPVYGVDNFKATIKEAIETAQADENARARYNLA